MTRLGVPGAVFALAALALAVAACSSAVPPVVSAPATDGDPAPALEEPLGARGLVDGSVFPPVDAAAPAA